MPRTASTRSASVNGSSREVAFLAALIHRAPGAQPVEADAVADRVQFPGRAHHLVLRGKVDGRLPDHRVGDAEVALQPGLEIRQRTGRGNTGVRASAGLGQAVALPGREHSAAGGVNGKGRRWRPVPEPAADPHRDQQQKSPRQHPGRKPARVRGATSLGSSTGAATPAKNTGPGRLIPTLTSAGSPALFLGS